MTVVCDSWLRAICLMASSMPCSSAARSFFYLRRGLLYGVPTLIIEHANDVTGAALRRAHGPLLGAAGQSRWGRGPPWAQH